MKILPQNLIRTTPARTCLLVLGLLAVNQIALTQSVEPVYYLPQVVEEAVAAIGYPADLFGELLDKIVATSGT